MNDLSFDTFMDLDSKERKKILNDIDLLTRLASTSLEKDRFDHSLSVARLSKDLATRHHIDPDKAYIAGLLHDVTKKYPQEFHDEYLKYYDIDKLNDPKGVKHSYSCKYFLKEKLNFHDKDILNAIYNHTICKSKDKLSLILYIADKREPLRNINDGIVEIAYNNLYKAYELLEVEVEKYLKEKNERIIEDSL